MRTIPVHTDPAYTVSVGPGLLKRCGQSLKEVLPPSCRLAVVTDSTVGPLYLSTVLSGLKEAGWEACAYTFPAGEGSKHMGTLSDILEFLAASHLTRRDCLIALGGGVAGDMAGFAAAVYLRGIRYVQLPTTLLSAVDSSVGGKTAIDLKKGKNLAGAFLQPSAVLCDTNCLKSLPQEVLSDGAAEAVKTGVLASPALFRRLEEGFPGLERPEEIIAYCVQYKAGVVERDEREQGERKLLNLGHTVGHAIEKCSGYAVPHGHAVAAGLAVISRAAEKLGWMEEAGAASRIRGALEAFHLPVSTEYTPEQLAEAALSDKKRAGNEITVAVPRSIGDCVLKTLPVTELLPVIRAGWEA